MAPNGACLACCRCLRGCWFMRGVEERRQSCPSLRHAAAVPAAACRRWQRVVSAAADLAHRGYFTALSAAGRPGPKHRRMGDCGTRRPSLAAAAGGATLEAAGHQPGDSSALREGVLSPAGASALPVQHREHSREQRRGGAGLPGCRGVGEGGRHAGCRCARHLPLNCLLRAAASRHGHRSSFRRRTYAACRASRRRHPGCRFLASSRAQPRQRSCSFLAERHGGGHPRTARPRSLLWHCARRAARAGAGGGRGRHVPPRHGLQHAI